MRRGWIPLYCVDCKEHWERSAEALPAPGNEFACDHCGSVRPVDEFIKTREGYEMLEAFHSRNETRRDG